MAGGWAGIGGSERDEQTASDVLAITLWLPLWLSCGSLVLAVADGLGAHPVRRLVVGFALVGACAATLARRGTVAVWLRARPWLVVPVAGVALGAAAIDGLLGSPYVALGMTSIPLAVVVARPRTVWLCVALLVTGHAAILMLEHPFAELTADRGLAGVLGALLGYPFVALVALGLVALFGRFVERVERTLDALRHGAPTLTPALARAIVDAGRAPLALNPAVTPLTPAERRVVDGLASGRSPKELAHGWGVSIATVRTHIRNAKRKTGTRTLTELAATAAGGNAGTVR